MPDLGELFRRYGPAYIERFGAAMPPSHRRAIEDIAACRTERMGATIYLCDHCHQFHYAYHSCRNRHCPTCHAAATDAWLDQRRQELLPVSYFHLVFTVPAELRTLLRSNQKALYPILIQAAAQSIIKLAADPKYVGGTVAVLALLHTWGRDLNYHPHVHCLVPAGGLDQDGQWRPGREKFLLPVRALSSIFRGIFLNLAAKALPGLRLPPPRRRRQQWVVYCKPALAGPHAVLDYLGRYVHRVAITNRRILSINDGKVTFNYTPTGTTKCKTMTLSANEFIRRFLQHVLPAGFHKVRYYGLWAPANRRRLRPLQAALLADSTSRPIPPPRQTPLTPATGWTGQLCPLCRTGRLVPIARLARSRRKVPLPTAPYANKPPPAANNAARRAPPPD